MKEEPEPKQEIVRAEPVTPLSLLAVAVNNNLDVAKLSALMDLQERHEKGIAVKAYNEAMNACQREMPVVVREKLNKGTSQLYAPLEAVSSVIKPIYTQHGFSLSFGTEECKLEKCVRVFCDVSHSGGDCRRYAGDFGLDDAGPKGEKNKTPVQAMGSTLTYGRRYLTLLIFNVTIADEDTDGQGTPKTVTDKQWEEMNTLLEETGHLNNSDKMQRFLKWANVQKLSDMTPDFFPKALDQLRRIKEKNGGSK